MSATQELKAGRELDALVAEKVMGFRRIAVPKDYDGLNDGETLVPSAFDENSGWTWAPKGRYAFEAFTPRYSTDIAAAWEVVNKIVAQDGSGWDYSFTIDSDPQGWHVTLVSNDHELSNGEGYFNAIANTPAEAICVAALRCVGISGASSR